MLSWNEIRHRAVAFSRDWKSTTSEKAERQTFWNEFFNIYGIRRKSVASFEEPVKKLSGHWSYIDLFWPSKVLVEHKSAGEDLDKAHAQGMDYIRGLIDSGREREVPRWLIVSDFQRIALHDLEPEQDPDLPLFKRLPPSIEFPLSDLHKHIRRFAFIPGYKQHKLDPEDPANIEATEIMAHLHDALKAGGFSGHDLRVLLVRLLFCLFADDTGIFNQQDFKLFLENRTAADGSDTGPKLARLFDVLNTREDQRQANLDEDLAVFPYINGDLFAERIAFADFNAKMRGQLLQACSFEWARISPAVFGSLFQGVMDPQARRQIGAHYTSERDIMKVIRPLFLDELHAEFQSAKADKSTRRSARLEALQERLAGLRFLDPACGCGNFLVITYRELRALELEILRDLHLVKEGAGQEKHFQTQFTTDFTKLSKVDVDQMYGIEIEEFPARIAEVALWLADHQANIALSETFGQLYRRIPLKKSPHIVCANALQTDWKTVLPPEQCSYILGNPPFVGKHLMTDSQNEDLKNLAGDIKGNGLLDFVAGWYLKSCDYIQGTRIRVALVSTSSITQGEQPGILWPHLYSKGIKIHFGHRTFPWNSEARGKAHVHCVIIGFAAFDQSEKWLYDYEKNTIEQFIAAAANISPYLMQGKDMALPLLSKPICKVPPIIYGSKPVDKGYLIVEEKDRAEFLKLNPGAAKYLRPLMCADEYLYNTPRWCLWLESLVPADVQANPGLRLRLEGVRQFRAGSLKEPTRRMADYPSLFSEIRQPRSEYILVPLHTSENRRYVPFGYFPPDHIIHNSCSCIPNASLFHFGVLSSNMHMAWMRVVCGRLESRYRYSNKLVYNNFPWPVGAAKAQCAKVEKYAKEVLEARKQFPSSTLADLYDSVSMPPRLAKAHEALDRAVDRCYRKEPFNTDLQRVEALFALYERITASST